MHRARMLKKILFALSLSACATIPKSEQVQIRAAHDFQCEAWKVRSSTRVVVTCDASHLKS